MHSGYVKVDRDLTKIRKWTLHTLTIEEPKFRVTFVGDHVLVKYQGQGELDYRGNRYRNVRCNILDIPLRDSETIHNRVTEILGNLKRDYVDIIARCMPEMTLPMLDDSEYTVDKMIKVAGEHIRQSGLKTIKNLPPGVDTVGFSRVLYHCQRYINHEVRDIAAKYEIIIDYRQALSTIPPNTAEYAMFLEHTVDWFEFIIDCNKRITAMWLGEQDSNKDNQDKEDEYDD